MCATCPNPWPADVRAPDYCEDDCSSWWRCPRCGAEWDAPCGGDGEPPCFLCQMNATPGLLDAVRRELERDP